MQNNAADWPVFDRLPDGTPVHAIALKAPSGLRAQILTYGGIMRCLQVPLAGKTVDAVLGFSDMAGYLKLADLYLGALVGRYCNRIRHGRFALDGREYQLACNFGKDHAHHLHGGPQGFSRKIWTVDDAGASYVLLRHESPAGEQGYPGHLRVSARYEVTDDGLQLTYRAHTDAATIVNLTHHPYFNLSGNPALPANRQRLKIPADAYLPTDAQGFPLGEIAPVIGTPFDLRSARTLADIKTASHAQLRQANGWDHCFVLQPWRTCAAELHSPDSGLSMRVHSPMPGLQLYGGQGLPEGLCGLCLEPQFFPDSPSFAHFPSAILHPGQEYVHCIDYRFALGE